MHMTQKLSNLRIQIHSALDGLIPPNSSCVLVDFPNHGNVGDSAIWLGEIAYLKRRNCQIRYACDSENYNEAALQRASGKDLILLHGGGNFGDLYPNHQQLKEKVIKRFPKNRIIQLPQSIHFADAANLARTQAILAQHPDFHFVVRDTPSQQFARTHFACQVYLCPDMALMLDLKPLGRRPKPLDAMVLSRTDDEKATQLTSNAPHRLKTDVTDWLDEPVPRQAWLYDWAHRRLGWGSSKIPPFILNRLALLAANGMAKQRLARGLGLLGQGNVVITDRLHAIILSWLGGAPVFYVDNSYNKLSNFVNTWLKDSPGLVRCASFEDALEQARAEYFPTSPVMTSSPA